MWHPSCSEHLMAILRINSILLALSKCSINLSVNMDVFPHWNISTVIFYNIVFPYKLFLLKFCFLILIFFFFHICVVYLIIWKSWTTNSTSDTVFSQYRFPTINQYLFLELNWFLVFFNAAFMLIKVQDNNCKNQNQTYWV